MFLSLIKKVIGSSNDNLIKKLRRIVSQINNLEDMVKQLSDSELRNKTDEFKNRIERGESLNDIMPHAFAVVREATARVLGTRHFDVQLIGGIVLHYGMIAEMSTGEGKTQVAALAAYLNALLGKGVHVVTVNDYLAERDSQWMGRVYNFLGMTVGCIKNDTPERERSAAYRADITYGTNNEFGFDFLRDNLKYENSTLVQRPYYYAIIDEADSVLIDEARTPLVISGACDDDTKLYVKIDKIVRNLEHNYYQIDEKQRTVILTDLGNEKIDQILIKNNLIAKGTNMYDLENMRIVHHLTQALRAHHLYKQDTEYLVHNGKLMIIDEFTGRLMEGRRYSEGLHQALEAKEGIKVLSENQTIASITFQNYFRMYPKLSGMTGTASTEATELREIYKLAVAKIPTNAHMVRKDLDDIIYKTANEKYRALVETILEANNNGQPILVGTVSVEKSEYLSDLLKKHGVKHNVLNAKCHKQEAEIIAQAGRFGAVTIATNMAGRGTDIMLGGNAEMLFQSLLSDPKSFKNHNKSNKKHSYDTKGFTIEFKNFVKLVSEINNESDEIIKKDKLEELRNIVYQHVENERKIVKDAGGLFVIGTERHESRRIDDQLRGRSGRQGDPGKSVFFLSLEDDLMRIFGSEKLGGFLTKLGLKENEAIIHPWISKSLRRAQQRVEMNNYEVRKSLLQFDDVMNEQRRVIYTQRNEIMNNPEVLIDTLHRIISIVIEDLVKKFIAPKSYKDEWDINGLNTALLHLLGMHYNVNEFIDNNKINDVRELIEKLVESINTCIIEQKFKEIYNNKDTLNKIIQSIFLTTLDQSWKEHLHNLDHLRTGIGLRAYGQKDPLIEYKFEAFSMFETMLKEFEKEIVSRIAHICISYNTKTTEYNKDHSEDLVQQKCDIIDDMSNESDNSYAANIAYDNSKKFFSNPNILRNQLCPCGSGKKYKYCHGEIQ